MKKAFATNVRNARKALGWKTQKLAAQNLGIKRATYQAYEEGRAMPGAEGLVNMCNVMGITNLLGFLSDPHFDYQKQDNLPRVKPDSPIQANYRRATERDRKLVDFILGVTA